MRFAFDLYDEDGGQLLGQDEVVTMLLEAYGGERHMPKHVYKIVNNLRRKFEEAKLEGRDSGEDSDMTKPDFVSFAYKNLSIFFPILTLQKELKVKILGENFWTKKNRELDKKQGKEREISFSFLKKIAKLKPFDIDAQNGSMDAAGGAGSLNQMLNERSEPIKASPILSRKQQKKRAEVEKKAALKEERRMNKDQEGDANNWREML